MHTKTKTNSENTETGGAVNEPSGFVASKKINEVEDIPCASLYVFQDQSRSKTVDFDYKEALALNFYHYDHGPNWDHISGLENARPANYPVRLYEWRVTHEDKEAYLKRPLCRKNRICHISTLDLIMIFGTILFLIRGLSRRIRLRKWLIRFKVLPSGLIWQIRFFRHITGLNKFC